jgi:hypothetical protein
MTKMIPKIKLIFTLSLPLAIILFGTITKWQYVYVEDGPDDFLYGFPLAYTCSGWHTSMSSKFFVTELLFDFFIYFVFCLTIVIILDRLFKPFSNIKILKFGLYLFASITLLVNGLSFLNPDNIFEMKRNFNYKEIKSGYKFVWQKDKR